MIEQAKAILPDVVFQEVNVAEQPAIGIKYGVTSTPAIAIDGKLEFTGVPREEALLARLRAAAGLPKRDLA